MKRWRRWLQRYRRWLVERRGYDVLRVRITVSKELLEDGNPVTADLVASMAEDAARKRTMERMGLVSS